MRSRWAAGRERRPVAPGRAARFAEDVANDTILGDPQVAMYDPEHWEATPPDEQLDPHASIEIFGTLARSKGYTVPIMPHPNLGLGPLR